jgi:RHS repeat-associated protein
MKRLAVILCSVIVNVLSLSAQTIVDEITQVFSPNRWYFSGKEEQTFLDPSLGILDFGARMYDPSIARWLSPDPLAGMYFPINPYVYCLGNPIIIIDPNGESTWVTRGANGKYIVTDKGNPFDNDTNIYLTYKDENGIWQRGESIGHTVSPFSFYNFDAKDEGGWAVGSVIDLADNSGIEFLQMFYDEPYPDLYDYITNARNGHKYDFKVTNGKNVSTYGAKYDVYRGMPINKGTNGRNVYASARDVGNIAAGYVAGANGIGWLSSRAAFDGYQVYSNISRKSSILDIRLTDFRRESKSSRIPEYYGWIRGFLRYNNETTLFRLYK